MIYKVELCLSPNFKNNKKLSHNKTIIEKSTNDELD